MPTHPSKIERLEPRIAPATLLNPRTVSYTDEDGDTVLVKISKGAFNGVVGGAPDATDFIFAPLGSGEVLQRIELSNDFEFQGAKITITAVQGATGDGAVNVGRINAAGIDLAEVAIPGDLGRIDVGDGIVKTPGLGKLKVNTLGHVGLTSQEAGGNFVSNITGRLGELTVATDIDGAQINVTGGGFGTIGKITVGQDLIGNATPGSASIIASGSIGPVKIGRAMTAGTGDESALISSTGGGIASVTVGGTIAGNVGIRSGAIIADLDIGPVTINGGGDLQGGAGDESGAIISRHGDLVSVKITGSLSGGSGDVTDSGVIKAGHGDVKKVAITQDIVGGSIAAGESATNVGAILGQNILSVIIGENIIAGTDAGDTLINSGAIRAEHQLKSLTVNGDIVGNASHFVTISGRGQLAPTATTDLAIGSVKVARGVEFANLLAGVTTLGAEVNPDAQIGTVTVGFDFLTSNIAAGVVRTDAFFGNLGDASIVAAPGTDTAIISKIASVTIGGLINGSGVMGESFGIVAEHVVKVLIGGAPVLQTLLPSNDLVPVSAGAATGDVFVLEVG